MCPFRLFDIAKENLIKEVGMACGGIIMLSHIKNKLGRTPSVHLWLRQLSVSTPLCGHPRDHRERIVILGSGWGGFRLAKDLDKEKFDVCVVSPRNHFLFTPLLPSTTVGTLEFGCIQEPVRTIAGISYFQSKAESVDFENKSIHCCDVHPQHQRELVRYDLPYDKLVIAVGSKSATFGIPGVASQEEISHNSGDGDEMKVATKPLKSETGTDHHNVMFLKQLRHARAIRNRILECFERASNPHVSEAERSRLLTFVVVGGGPTSVEFTSELYDFLKGDVAKWYSDLRDDVRVVVIEREKHLLGAFDSQLQRYVERRFRSRNVEMLTEVSVKEVLAESVVLESIGEDGSTCTSELPFGLCVWSIGNQPLNFVSNLNLDHFEGGPNRGRIKVDGQLRVCGGRSVSSDVYAMGDCAANHEQPLGLLAQVANQQGMYLAKHFNTGTESPFKYRFFGSMAQLGTFDAVVEGPKGGRMKGFVAFVAWRSAYWVKSVSITNKFLIPMFWFKSFWFGRDISKF